jgi:putative transposase
MLFQLLYSIVRLIVDVAKVWSRTEVELQAEVLALRHQLRVLERQVSRPRWQPGDRLVLAALAQARPRPTWRSILVSPETLTRWHRELVRRKWALYTRRRVARSHPSRAERQQLILQLARENPRWGYRRIQGELLKLGHKISHITVRNVLRGHGVLPAPRRSQRSWRQFVREHADVLLATDFFVVDTVWLTQIYVLFFIEVGSRRIHLAGCTRHPDRAWVEQQARNLAWKIQDGELAPRFLLHDRDTKFTHSFDEIFEAEGAQVIRLPFQAPRANAFAERRVGTVRREALDQCLIFGCRHLEHVLREFVDHYHVARPHQGLEQRPPVPQPSSRAGPVVRRDRLGGLLHEYHRAAA